MRVRAFKRRISVSKRTSAFVGENEKRSETKDVRNEVYSAMVVRAEEKARIIRTDDGGAVVAHHAHDERVCVASCVFSQKAFALCSLKKWRIFVTFCFSTNIDRAS